MKVGDIVKANTIALAAWPQYTGFNATVLFVIRSTLDKSEQVILSWNAPEKLRDACKWEAQYLVKVKQPEFDAFDAVTVTKSEQETKFQDFLYKHITACVSESFEMDDMKMKL